MDLRQYYKKLHDLESRMTEEHVLVVSVDTGDGGKEGVITEASRRNACQLILEGRARRVEPKEEEEFRSKELAQRDEFRRMEAASKVQLQFVPAKAGRPTRAKSGK